MEAMEVVFGEKTRCEHLKEPGVVNLIASVVILIGMLISYLPQHYRIISRGTSEGISPYFILLGVTSATSGFGNILTLAQSRQDVGCCRELDTFHCMAGLLGIAQLGVQWICFAFILVLFLVFFRFEEVGLPATEGETSEEQPTWQTALMVAAVCLVHGLAVIITTALLFTVWPNYLVLWANSLGVMAAALAAIQYIPQIIMTYRLKHVGSLSIPMMCIQTPGGYVFAASLFARLGWSGWSSWGIFLLTATMQGVLLFLAIWYEVQRATPAPSPPQSPKSPDLPAHQQPIAFSSTRYDDSRPSRYSAHPQHYGTTPEEISDIIDRQDGEAATETQPLLRPGGIGNPHRNRDTVHG